MGSSRPKRNSSRDNGSSSSSSSSEVNTTSTTTAMDAAPATGSSSELGRGCCFLVSIAKNKEQIKIMKSQIDFAPSILRAVIGSVGRVFRDNPLRQNEGNSFLTARTKSSLLFLSNNASSILLAWKSTYRN
jgi:hypothetical protein